MKKITIPSFLKLISAFLICISYNSYAQTATIISSDLDNFTCKGDAVTFTAGVSGTLPTCTTNEQSVFSQFFYAWYLNGNQIPNSNSISYLFTSLNEGDRVECTVTYEIICLLDREIRTQSVILYSNFIINHVYPNYPNLRNITPTADVPAITETTVTYSIPSTSITNLNYQWSYNPLLGSLVSSNGTSITLNLTETPGVQSNIMVNATPNGCTSTATENSNPLSITTYNTPPTNPTNLQLTGSPDAQSITLSWLPSSDNGTVTYNIYYQDLSLSTSYTPIIGNISVTPSIVTATVSNLQEAHTYKFYVVAQDNDLAISGNSNTTDAYTIDHVAPPVPINLRQIEETDSYVTFSWSPSLDDVGTVGYNVYVNGTPFIATGTMYSANISNFPVTFNVSAFDAKGNTSSQSSPLVVSHVAPINTDPVTGYVGIGVNPASERLDIDGNLKVRGDIIMDKFDKTKPDVITFTGASLDIFTPVQGQYNKDQQTQIPLPIVSISQWGEFKFLCTPYLNYHDIKFLGTNDYKNLIGYRDDFGGKTGIHGPVLSGEGGGALGSKEGTHWDDPEKVALLWDNNNRTTLTGSVIVQGGIDGTLNRYGTADASGHYTGPTTNFNYLGKITSGGRMVLQEHMTAGDPSNALSNWGRMLLSNNLEWDPAQAKYHVMDVSGNADLQMLRYENHGGMAFYTRNQFSSGFTPNEVLPSYIDQATLDQKYRRMSITGHGTVVIGNQVTDVLEVINAANQNTKLKVFGDTRLTGDLYVNDSKLENLWQKVNTAGDISYTGNVGIGTGVSSPLPDKLQVAGNMSLKNANRATYWVRDAGNGVLGYSLRTQTGGGWAWQFVDGANTQYFSVDYPSGNTTVKGTFNAQGGLQINGVPIVQSPWSNVTGGISYGNKIDVGGRINMTGSAHFTFSNVGGGGIINFGNGNSGDLLIRKLAVAGNINNYTDILKINNNGNMQLFGTLSAKHLIINTNASIPDYVFEEGFKLESLTKTEEFVNKFHHLPGVASAKEISENGLNIEEMNIALLKQVEILTLHLIKQEKNIAEQKDEIEILKKKIK